MLSQYLVVAFSQPLRMQNAPQRSETLDVLP